MKPKLNLEISPLGERFHTGISNVTKYLAGEMLGDTAVDPAFWFNRQEIPPRVIEKVIQSDGAPQLWWLAGRLATPISQIWRSSDAIGIFPGHKWGRRYFEFEALIIHDLTAIITPEYHNSDTIQWENGRLLPDILCSDLLVSVSESTFRDVREYFPQANHIPMIVSHLAPCSGARADIHQLIGCDPYILVLGTLEPRKNVSAVLQMLRDDAYWLENYRFVFAGRWGWGDSIESMIDNLGLTDAVKLRRIQFTGFISNSERDNILANASCLIYPSRYEGFGLPIIEALHYGVPVVTGSGSSLNEVGGAFATYIDTDQRNSLAPALLRTLQSDSPSLRQSRIDWSDRFTWRRTYERIRDAAVEGLAVNRASGVTVG